jgi:hypothetical protein
MTQYRLRIPMPAILDKPGGRHIPVTLPAGAMLVQSSQPSTTLFGMVGVYWEGRHYSVYPKDLVRATERVEGA